MIKDDDIFNEKKIDRDTRDINTVPIFEKEKIDVEKYLETNENNFFISASNIYPTVMRLFNWIMRHAYLIVVVYIAILFFIKLGS